MWSGAVWSFLLPPSQGVTVVSALNNCLLSVIKLPLMFEANLHVFPRQSYD